MKKLLGRCFSLCLCLLFAATTIPTSAALQTDSASQYAIHEPYTYPIATGTEEWAALPNLDAMIAAVQIPEEVLTSMDTPALLQTVLDYPMTAELYAFNSFAQGFAVVSERCNGIPELLSRPDALDVIYSAYQAFPIEQNPGASEQVGYNAVFVQPLLEALLYAAVSNSSAGYTNSSQLSQIEATVLQKQAEKDASGEYGTSNHIYEKLATSDAVMPYATATTVSTPKGTKVPVLIRGEELSSAEKTSINSDMARQYPNAVRIAEPTTNYNCHSYAWYSTSTSNRYWMNSPSAYMTDGSYAKRNGSSGSVSGDRVFYSNGTHSAIEISSHPIRVRSKWGQCGVYEHNVDYGPYSGPFTYWYR